MKIRHNFVSSKSEGADNTLVRPSNWNADHTINIAYAQLSDANSQAPSTTSPTLVLMRTHDEISEITHSVSVNPGNLTIQRAGLYFIMAAAQVGKSSGTTDINVDMWFRKNGVDIVNSNVRNSVSVNTDTKVVVAQCVISLAANDLIQVYISVSDATFGAGLKVFTPVGEPVVPSIIFTMYEL